MTECGPSSRFTAGTFLLCPRIVEGLWNLAGASFIRDCIRSPSSSLKHLLKTPPLNTIIFMGRDFNIEFCLDTNIQTIPGYKFPFHFRKQRKIWSGTQPKMALSFQTKVKEMQLGCRMETVLLILLTELTVKDTTKVINFMDVHFAE